MHRLARKRQMALGHFGFSEEQYRVVAVVEVVEMDVALVRDQVPEKSGFHISSELPHRFTIFSLNVTDFDGYRDITHN